jgi:hypothetical protein
MPGYPGGRRGFFGQVSLQRRDSRKALQRSAPFLKPGANEPEICRKGVPIPERAAQKNLGKSREASLCHPQDKVRRKITPSHGKGQNSAIPKKKRLDKKRGLPP